MSKPALNAEKLRFIEEVAALLAPWGMPPSAARMYGYLLLCAGPVSLDQIAEDLELSKSSASVSARLLERYTLARRHGERGSKRALYGVSDNFAGLLSEQSFLLGAIGNLLHSRAGQVASGATSRRIKEMGAFYLSMREAMDKSILDMQARIVRKK